MNLFSRALAFFHSGSISNNDTGAQAGLISNSTDAGISVSDERAMQLSAVWACVQYITNSVCSLPLNFYRKTDDGGREEIIDGPLNALFHISPNQWMKPRDFRKAMTMQLCFWSNAYAEITWSGKRPVAIMPLRPGRMTPVINADGSLVYHYQTDKGMIVYAQKSIMHMKGFGADGISGMERGSYARKTLGLSVSADVYASKQFANGGRPGGGFLMFDDFLTTEQRDNAKKLYSGMSETAYNQGKVWMLEGGVKFETDALNPDTMQMIETRKMQLGEIARFFGVPEVLIGAGGGGTSAWPASFEQQLLSFLTFTLQDYIDEWEMAIKDSLIADKRNEFADHDVSGFIKMDSKTRAEVQSIQAQNGLKTRNELRRANNDSAKDGGDGLTVQVNLAPLDMLGVVPDVPVPAAPEPNTEMSDRLLNLEIKEQITAAMPTEEKADAPVFNITVQPGAAPRVDVQNDVHVPEQKQPIVNVTNEVEAPLVQNTVTPPDVKVTVPVPDVTIENTVNVPCADDSDKKVTFNRDSKGNITDAVLEDG